MYWPILKWNILRNVPITKTLAACTVATNTLTWLKRCKNSVQLHNGSYEFNYRKVIICSKCTKYIYISYYIYRESFEVQSIHHISFFHKLKWYLKIFFILLFITDLKRRTCRVSSLHVAQSREFAKIFNKRSARFRCPIIFSCSRHRFACSSISIQRTGSVSVWTRYRPISHTPERTCQLFIDYWAISCGCRTFYCVVWLGCYMERRNSKTGCDGDV